MHIRAVSPRLSLRRGWESAMRLCAFVLACTLTNAGKAEGYYESLDEAVRELVQRLVKHDAFVKMPTLVKPDDFFDVETKLRLPGSRLLSDTFRTYLADESVPVVLPGSDEDAVQILHGQWRLTPKGLQLSLSIVEPTKVGTQDVYAQSQRPIVARVRAKAGVLSEGFDPSDFEPTLEDWGQAVVRRIEKGVGRTRHRTVHFQPLRGRESDQLALDLTDWLWDAFAHSALFTLIEPGIASVPVSDQTDGNLVGRVSIRGEYVKVNLSVFDNRGQLVTSAAVSLKKGLVSHTVIIDVDVWDRIRPMYAGAGGGIVRSGPGESHGETGRLEPWSEVGTSGTARGGRWLRIERPGGRVGFVRAHLLSTAMPVERRFQDCHGCPEMVVVPAGEFEMGLSPSKAVRGDEVPAHDVRIEYRMAVGMYEVTLAEFRKFVEETNFSAPGSCWAHDDGQWKQHAEFGWRDPGFPQDERAPVVCVSWEDAQAYVKWLTEKTGERYRLPSESEWGYLARAGTTTRYHWGEEIRQGHANCGECGSPWDDVGTSPVGSFAANAYGLHDVHGNVWEWVQDCWNEDYRDAPSDGSAWEETDCEYRVLRGGSWRSGPEDLRSAIRGRDDAASRSEDAGFRVVRPLAP